MYKYTKDSQSTEIFIMRIIKIKELKCNQEELNEILIKQNQRIEKYWNMEIRI